MDACESIRKARIMIFSCFSNFPKFSRAFITALRMWNHEPCLKCDPSYVLFILDINYVYLCGVLVFFQEVSGLRTFEQLLVILLCFIPFIDPSALKSFGKFLRYFILIDCLYRQTYDIITSVIKHYAVDMIIMM